MQQLDQYKIPIQVIMGESVITPDDVSDLVIKLGNNQLSYSNNEITYNASDGAWEFPLTAEMSKNMAGNTLLQVAVIQDDEQILSAVQIVNVNASIIEEVQE